MRLPFSIQWKTRAGKLKQAMGKTGDISGNGLFIEIPIHLPPATSLVIKVVLPRKATQVPLELSCQARVVRWKQVGQVKGLCVVIDEYGLRPIPRAALGDKRPLKQLIRVPSRPGIPHKGHSM